MKATVFTVGVVIVGLIIILGLGISMLGSIPAPEQNTPEYDQYTNLSKIVNITYSGMWAVILLLLSAIILMAVYLLIPK